MTLYYIVGVQRSYITIFYYIYMYIYVDIRYYTLFTFIAYLSIYLLTYPSIHVYIYIYMLYIYIHMYIYIYIYDIYIYMYIYIYMICRNLAPGSVFRPCLHPRGLPHASTPIAGGAVFFDECRLERCSPRPWHAVTF